MTRILHLVAGLGQGGAERQLTLLCRETAGAVKHEVLSARDAGFHAAELAQLHVPVQSLGASSLYSPTLLWKLTQHLRASRPDILHCWLPSMNLMGALATRLALPLSSAAARPAVIASIRNVDDWKNPARIALDRLASRLWDRVLCNSRAGLECARAQGLPEDKLHWVPNGVLDREPICPATRRRLRYEAGVPQGGILLVSACRLVPQKHVDLLLPIVRILRGRFPGIRLLICGDGPESHTLHQKAVDFGLTNEVHFAGAVSDAWPYLCAADALLMSSEREGTSNTLLEAMQAGAAIFATAVGDNSALVSGAAGWTGDISRMASALEDALADPATLAAYRAGALRRAREFSVPKMAASTLAHYEAALRRGSAPHHAKPALGTGD